MCRMNLLPVLALLSCTSTGLDGNRADFLHASVRGATVKEFAGSARFSVNNSPPADRAKEFTLTSQELGRSPGDEVILERLGDGIPPIGRYELSPLSGSGATARGFMALYTHRGEAAEMFVSRHGEIRVTESNAEHVAGSFRFTAVRYCRISRVDVKGSCHPLQISEGEPEIEVHGSFSASHREGTVQLSSADIVQ